MDWKTITLNTRWPFRLSYGVTEKRTVYWLRLSDECGWGEAAIPPYYGVRDEEMIGLWQKKAREARPLPEDIKEIPSWVGEAGPAPARCALDMALHDYLACRRGIPLYELLGAPRPNPALTTLTIPLASPAEMAAMAAHVKNFPRLKVKLGSEDDIGRIDAVRKARPDAALLVDANCGWTADAAVKQIHRLEEYGVEMIEQPVPREDLDGLAHVQRQVEVPILADESVCTLEHLEKVAALGIRAVNLKLMKTGGLSTCLKMIRRARELGIQIMLGCMIETSLAVTAMAHLSAWADWIDLDSPLLIKNDPFIGVRYKNALMYLPDAPGIGATRRYPQEVEDLIERFKHDPACDRRTTVFDVQITCPEEARVKICGQVLHEPQKKVLLASLAEIEAVDEEIAVLLHPDTPRALVTRVVTDLVKKPDCLAERVNQALLGDPVRILEQESEWARVQLERDGYLGWIQAEALLAADAPSCRDYPAHTLHLVISPFADAFSAPSTTAVKTGMLPFGLKVRVKDRHAEFAAVELPDGRIWWVCLDCLLSSSSWPGADESGIATCLGLARRLVGAFYLWGGCTPFGYDCSGLTQVFWSLMGVKLPRDADQQYRQGIPVAVSANGRGAEPGDLLFFGKAGNEEAGIPPEVPHVALSLGDSDFLHANGTSWSVTYNSLSPGAPGFRADLHNSFIGARRCRVQP